MNIDTLRTMGMHYCTVSINMLILLMGDVHNELTAKKNTEG